MSGFAIGGMFKAEHYSVRGNLIHVYYAKNGITLLGLNHVLEVLCRQQTQSTWKIGLMDNTGFTALSEDDQMNSHAGWTEVVDYEETTRPLWAPGTTSGQAIINAGAVVFTFTADKDINGLFVTSDDAKSGTAGLLFCTGSFDASATMQIGEQLKCFYRIAVEGR